MDIFRLLKTKHAQEKKDILSGEGSRLFGSRWNPIGVPLICTSATPELALLEVLAHLNGTSLQDLPPYSIITISIPDEFIHKIAIENLPEGWRSYQNYEITQKSTENWLKEQKSLVLQVPSAIVPMSYNFLINPQHSDIEKVNVIHSEVFIFDERYLIKSPVNFMSSLFNEMTGEL
jgi:RES domain-containing protein